MFQINRTSYLYAPKFDERRGNKRWLEAAGEGTRNDAFCTFRLFQIQIFGFNSQLYSNFSEALHKAQGIVVISLLLQVRILLIRKNKTIKAISINMNSLKRAGGMLIISCSEMPTLVTLAIYILFLNTAAPPPLAYCSVFSRLQYFYF